MKKVAIPIQFTEFENISELSDQDRLLVEIARKMTQNAYAPYSEFSVGTAVLLDNGEIVTGSNQENAAYPSGLCAERVATFSASANHPQATMKTIAISANNKTQTMDYPVTPCGACRQVMLEYETRQSEPIKVILSGNSGKIYILEQVKDLLPLTFTVDDLKRL